MKNLASEIVILGDIGGTNCRLANCETISGKITDIEVVPVRELGSFKEAIRRFMNIHTTNRYKTAAISIANPITSDRVTMTNAHWDFSIEQTRKNSGLDQLIMLNDWESVALALPSLKGSELLQINSCDVNDFGNRAICGVGTGLGAAGLVQCQDSPWVTIASEGGHVSFSPMDEDETDILKALGKNEKHVSFEKILSGDGLSALYEVNAELAGVAQGKTLKPAEIITGAREGNDPMCRHTIAIFCGVLGNFAGNLCLTLGALGGVYVGGGVVQKINEARLFDKARFLNRFTHKGRLAHWLANVPIYIITTQHAGLIGAAKALGIGHAHVEQTS